MTVFAFRISSILQTRVREIARVPCTPPPPHPRARFTGLTSVGESIGDRFGTWKFGTLNVVLPPPPPHTHTHAYTKHNGPE